MSLCGRGLGGGGAKPILKENYGTDNGNLKGFGFYSVRSDFAVL
jgi:hypothetical protein